MEAETSYNVLIGRKNLNRLGAIVSTPHIAMKFPVDNGDIITIKVDPKEARECYALILKVASYSIKSPSDAIIEDTLELSTMVQEEEQCHNIEISSTLAKDSSGIDLDPHVKF